MKIKFDSAHITLLESELSIQTSDYLTNLCASGERIRIELGDDGYMCENCHVMTVEHMDGTNGKECHVWLRKLK
jgi:hypothetical protein